MQGYASLEENYRKLWMVRQTEADGFEPSTSYLSASRT